MEEGGLLTTEVLSLGLTDDREEAWRSVETLDSLEEAKEEEEELDVPVVVLLSLARDLEAEEGDWCLIASVRIFIKYFGVSLRFKDEDDKEEEVVFWAWVLVRLEPEPRAEE